MHKGDFSQVAILEGDPGTRGASRLCAYTAFRAGAGTVTLLVDDYLQYAPGDQPEFMQEKASKTKLERASVLVLGPGVTTRSRVRKAYKLLKKALSKDIPIVLDAGAIPLIKRLSPRLSSESVIIATPHPGEAARFLGISTADVQADRPETISQLLSISSKLQIKVIWVLKGANSIVADSDSQLICEGDVPTLAVGGSGDVLSGAIAGAWWPGTGGLSWVQRVVQAHLDAGRQLSTVCERGHFAREIADELAMALSQTPQPDSPPNA